VAAEPEDERAGSPDASDPLLDGVLRAQTEESRAEAMTELLSKHVYWRVDRILGGRFRRSSISGDHRDDVRAEVLLKLVHRLHRLVRDAAAEPLKNFADYVSVVTFNTFDDFMRRAFPLRTSLKNRIRYALRHDDRFAEWSNGEVLMCGLARWSASPAPLPVEPENLSVVGGSDIRAVLSDLFAQGGGPMELDAVVSRIATSQFPAGEESRPIADSRTAERLPGAELESLQSLRALWNEILELPRNQRVALLLGARDSSGESVTQFLRVMGVTTIHQMATALSIEAEEFADLWHDLPLEDTKIAAILGLTRQQVINLRRSARERLGRRLGKPGRQRRSS
jgi:hypothetical protein